jgi:glycosyltransferase involved in cell wall biosynthesis
MYPDEFHIDIDYEAKLKDDEWLSQYDIIHYHRTCAPYEEMGDNVDENQKDSDVNDIDKIDNVSEGFISRCKRLGIVTIMDLDDHWNPGPHHPAYHIIKKNELDKKIRANIKGAENITTTTPIFAEEISKVNPNVTVLPNAIDPNEKQYTPNPEKSDRLRIGWLGGSSHLKDLEILRGIVGKLINDGLIDKVQFVLCGFDLRGVITMIDEKTGQQRQRPIKPTESVWYQYEKIFTSDYKSVSPEYKNHLLKFTKEEYPNVVNEPYRRVWTKPISTYASNYNLFDISLAPLEENLFNKVKSQLKVIEAGFHKKALVAQDYGPYQIDCNNAYVRGGDIDPDGNALLVRSGRNHKEWYKHLKNLILNPDLVKQLQDNLHNTVKDKYSIEAVAKTRRDLYQKLVSEMKEKKKVSKKVATES